MIIVTVVNNEGNSFPSSFQVDDCKCDLQKYVRSVIKANNYKEIIIARE